MDLAMLVLPTPADWGKEHYQVGSLDWSDYKLKLTNPVSRPVSQGDSVSMATNISQKAGVESQGLRLHVNTYIITTSYTYSRWDHRHGV